MISHTPKANEKVPPGTKIDFVVSNGKPIIYSPKKLVIPLPQDIEVMEVVVTKLENEETKQVYSGTHQMGEESITIAVSYTHLDVYKRQGYNSTAIKPWGYPYTLHRWPNQPYIR